MWVWLTPPYETDVAEEVFYFPDKSKRIQANKSEKFGGFFLFRLQDKTSKKSDDSNLPQKQFSPWRGFDRATANTKNVRP